MALEAQLCAGVLPFGRQCFLKTGDILIKLEKIETKDVKELYRRIKRDFPPSEHPPRSAFWFNMKRGAYQSYYFVDDGGKIGYAVVSIGGSEFALLSFFAVEPQLRGMGYGGDLLELLFNSLGGKDVLIEVEDPAKANDEEDRLKREGRIRFYSRAGFALEPVERCRIFNVDMLIMHYGVRSIESVRAVMHGVYLKQLLIERVLRKIDIVDKEPQRA
jgi:GNAT superfamily N-acetyltransferase